MTDAVRSLSGRAVLVTGVSREIGIGAAIAREVAARGADVFIASWPEADAEQSWGASPQFADELVRQLRATGVRAGHLAVDLADPASPEALFDTACAHLGHIDAVVANHARSCNQDLEHLTVEEIDACFAVNTRASLLLAKEFAARHDDARPGGRIVLFTSGQHLGPMPTELPYAISKGAIQQMTASLAAYLAPRAITVNCVNPGPTDTGWADPDLTARVLDLLPQGRWGRPRDAALLVAWLLSDEAQWIVGQTINSEGGFTRA